MVVSKPIVKYIVGGILSSLGLTGSIYFVAKQSIPNTSTVVSTPLFGGGQYR